MSEAVAKGVVHHKVVQRSDEWRALRCGLITASEVSLLLTAKKLAPADNDKSRAHVYELTAQRISRYVEPGYVGFDMIRGDYEEIEARAAYSRHYAPVTEIGFITNDKWGFTIGYSPDGLIGDDGLIEAKSRAQKHQVKTLLECQTAGTVPEEYVLQVQTGLLVSERKWLDFISYSGGLPMAVIRVLPDRAMQDAIVAVARKTEEAIASNLARYAAATRNLIATERRNYDEDIRI